MDIKMSLRTIAGIFLALLSCSKSIAQPVDGNVDGERLGIEIEHWQEDGTYKHHFRGNHWSQGGRSDFTKLGLNFQGPIFPRISISGSTGIIRTFKKSDETRDLSGYDYDGDGIYWNVSLWWNFRSR